MTRPLLMLLFTMVSCAAADTIQAFGLRRTVPIAADWIVNSPVLNLLVPRPSTQPRRPTQCAIADTPDYITVTVEAEMKKQPESAVQQAVHNGIFQEGPGTLLEEKWYKVRFVYDGHKGDVQVFVDGEDYGKG